MPEQGGGHWAEPGCGRTAPSLARANLALAVACRHGEDGWGGFLICARQTDLHVTIKEG